MKIVIIYPNQLYSNHPALRKDQKIFIVEDPLFFGDEQYPLNFHKKKLLLHFASIQSYKEELDKRGYDVEIYPYEKLRRKNHNISMLKSMNTSHISLANVVDFTLEKRLLKAAKTLNIRITWFDTPGFFLSNEEVNREFKNKKKYLMNSFYINQRKKLNILLDDNYNPIGGKWSFDSENRKKLPKKIIIPSVKKIEFDKTTLSFSKNKINKYFDKNLGTMEGFNFPVTRLQAKKSFKDFLLHRLELFGTYEDAISKNNNFLFHGVITPYLNIGLMTPREIIEDVIDFAEQNSVPINSLEGFIRQVIGWREFIRGIYTVDGVKQRNSNFWNFTKGIPESFYNAKTGLLPLDNAINRCLETGYTHHIERLMILGNIMVLLQINPQSVYNWFMELFIDSYDWVMVPNIYGMSQFSDGGLMSTKPYISGSNYILKMSDYKKGDWTKTWDALYWNFINNNRLFFKKNPRMSMMVSMYDKQSEKKKVEDSKIVQECFSAIF